MIENDKKDLKHGFFAQDIQKIMPDLVTFERVNLSYTDYVRCILQKG